jgi:transposase-like protein
MTRPDVETGRSGPAEAGPACPFCGSTETEMVSLFGSSALTSQYYCRACRSAFEQVKWGSATSAPRSPLRAI